LRRLVARDQRGDDLLGAPAVAKHLEANRSKADVDEGLRGNRADARLQPGHDRSHGIGVRLHGDAEPTADRVAGHDAVRHVRSLRAAARSGVTGCGVHSEVHETPTRRPSGDLDGPSRQQPEEVPMRAFIVELTNTPGSLASLTEAIAERGINITGVAGATCGGSGSVGLITNDEASTSSVL